MGKLGRLIDRLTPETRDGLVTAQDWTHGRSGNSYVGLCVGMQVARAIPGAWLCPEPTVLAGLDMRGGPAALTLTLLMPGDHPDTDVASEMNEERVGLHYDRLCQRFGQDRVVRAIKLRAGARVRLGEEALVAGA